MPATPALKIPEGALLLGKSNKAEVLYLRLANRHGLITGATGTGKTVTLQTLAEGFSNNGVAVFAADIKGDLSGIAAMGDGKKVLVDRSAEIGVPYKADKFPVAFWDLFGEQGHRIRTTISEMGPLLLSRLMELNDTQEGVLNILFRYADEQKLLLLDLKDLRALLSEMGSNKELQAELQAAYGNVTSASVGAIQRQLLVLENQGGENFFGEPALDMHDFIKTDRDGRGMVNILAADKLMENPKLYSTFLLWMLSELFQILPEAGDLDQPKIVFFFDEAHLLFKDAPTSLVDKIEQIVRLIRSKGVGVYFVTQNPLDIPETVLAQLGNRVQHALRAFTPRDQKAVKTAADTFRQNPAFNTQEAITQLAVGEALVSTLEGKGTPSIVERTFIKPPQGRVGPVTPAERAAIINASPFKGKYDTEIDRESAFEVLQGRHAAPAEEEASSEGGGILGSLGGMLGGLMGSAVGGPVGSAIKTASRTSASGKAGGATPRGRMSTGEIIVRNVAGSAARTIGTQIARSVLRGVLGGMMRR